jgi:hypothetical protein
VGYSKYKRMANEVPNTKETERREPLEILRIFGKREEGKEM